MKIHHLDCGPMNPVGGPYVCHVLLLETDTGLVLVDSGFGLDDSADPARRIGPLRHVIRPTLNPADTAARHIERLGFHREDVRHIVVTHLDFDHIGGIADFPDAQIHTTSAEASSARARRSIHERTRYRPALFAHDVKFVEHDPAGEHWRGFAAAKPLEEIAPGIVLISLPGHTRGHACVAVDAGHRWVLHAGDSFYHPGTLDGSSVPVTVRLSESAFAYDRKQVRENHERLAELYRRRESDLLIVSAHSPELLERAQATQ